MKNLKRSAFGLSFLIALLCLQGCEDSQKPLAVYRTENPDYQTEKLFTDDGCTVYKFSDEGRSHYFAKCVDAKKVEVIGTHSETCGKNCTKTLDENVKTIR